MSALHVIKKILRMVQNWFVSHPESIGETYLQHFFIASWISIRAFTAGMTCLLHAVFPFIFEKTASTILENIVRDMQNRKNKCTGAQ